MISSNLTLQNLCVLLNCVMKSVSNDIHDSCNLIFGQYATSFLFSLIYFPEKFTFINNSTSSMSRRIANDLEIFFGVFLPHRNHLEHSNSTICLWSINYVIIFHYHHHLLTHFSFLFLSSSPRHISQRQRREGTVPF